MKFNDTTPPVVKTINVRSTFNPSFTYDIHLNKDGRVVSIDNPYGVKFHAWEGWVYDRINFEAQLKRYGSGMYILEL